MRSRAPTVTNAAADRAGDVLRRLLDGNLRSGADPLTAYEIASNYRSMHSYPMTKVTNGVTHYVRSVTGDESISAGQRFKRMDRILGKLKRYPSMRLSQMEDI